MAIKNKEYLINHSYNNYKWFTLNSRLGKRMEKPKSKPAINTIGYEGYNIDRFLNRLLEMGVEQLIDIRERPIARKYGFHKSTLSRLCSKLEISYHHLKELGVPSEYRENLNSDKDYQVLFRFYSDNVILKNKILLSKTAEKMRQKPSVLLCYEADFRRCHRLIASQALSEISGLPINNLE